MGTTDTTSWTLILGASQGDEKSRHGFVARYSSLVSNFLGHRWRGNPLLDSLPDAVQEVFMECFRAGGALDRLETDRPGGFRAFFYGVLRNVALRFEKRRRRTHEVQPGSQFDAEALPASGISASKQFDRAWALDLLRRAARHMAARARTQDEEAERRWEILRLRFQEDLPIREIARRWEMDPLLLHRKYTKARKEFRLALTEVLAEGKQLSPREVEQALAELSQILGET